MSLKIIIFYLLSYTLILFILFLHFNTKNIKLFYITPDTLLSFIYYLKQIILSERYYRIYHVKIYIHNNCKFF